MPDCDDSPLPYWKAPFFREGNWRVASDFLSPSKPKVIRCRPSLALKWVGRLLPARADRQYLAYKPGSIGGQ